MKKITEDTLIAELEKRFRGTVPLGHVGIGDDCALLPSGDAGGWIISTDLLVEGVHFLKKQIKPRDLGWKALAVSLSDIAAKGGAPSYAFLSLALEKDTDSQWVKAFYDGFASLARMTGTILLGGDTSRSLKGCFVNVLVIGRAHDHGIKLRKHALEGDLICVTGSLGDSAAGLVLQGKKSPSPIEKKLVRRHHLPNPRLDEGRFLAARTEVRATMDLSDGLDTDLRRLITASGTGAHIDVGALPVSSELRRVSFKEKKFSELPITGGEDYELLLTCDPASFATLAADFRERFTTPLTCIGIIEAEKGLRYTLDDEPFTPRSRSFDHF